MQKCPSVLIRVATVGLVALLAIGASPTNSQASVFKHAKHVSISKAEPCDDDLYVYANTLSVDGLVSGDLTAFCYRTHIKGEIGQSANLFGRDVRLSGKIDGSLRALGQSIVVDGYVTRSAVVLGQDVTFNQGSVVERDLSVWGSVADLSGAVRGDVRVNAARVSISGVITGNVLIEADQIEIIKPAVITGNLTYISKDEATIDTAQGVSVAGPITWKLPEKKKAEEEAGSGLTSFLIRVSGLLAAFIFGLIVVRIFQPYAEESFNQLKTRFSVTIAAGLLGILALLVCVVILILSVIFMVAGWALVSGELPAVGSIILVFSTLMIPITSFASVSGAVILYSGKIVVALVIGYLIMSKAHPDSMPLGKAGLFLGLVILSLLFAVPYVGVFLYWAAAIIGGGAILLGIKNCHRPVWGSTQGTGTPPNGGPVDIQGQA